MATSEARYRMTLTCKLEKEGVDEPPMNETEVVWNGLPYGNAVVLQGIQVEALQRTVDLGLEIASALGQGPVAEAAKGGK